MRTAMKPILPLLMACLLLSATPVPAGSYLDSAHGSATDGVLRPVIGNAPPSGFGYARGNCAHCHEQHASIAGAEPDPVTGPAYFALFAPNFDTARQTGSYSEADDFCFYCHNDAGSAQPVNNNDYSRTFGCGVLDTTSIMATMNQLSYHNLYDIWNFANGRFSWFRGDSNPCNGCHNPHLARRNRSDPRDPTLSVLSRPTDHFSLWGTTETMGSAYNTRYEPPYCTGSGTDREPDASATAAAGRAATPDYVTFCTDCHNTAATIASTTLGRNLRPIDWSSTGDKHGLRVMDGGLDIRLPFSASGDYVLSCTDCHEPHGSPNVMLIRRRINGGDLEGNITTSTTPDWSFACKKCHLDDQETIGGDSNAWRYVHHSSSDAPYSGSLAGRCPVCHGPGPPDAIDCDECHYHGAVIDITEGNNAGTSRRAF